MPYLRLKAHFCPFDRLIFVLSENEVVDFIPFCVYRMVLLPGVGFYSSLFGSSVSD
jgi:hypothetical protein